MMLVAIDSEKEMRLTLPKSETLLLLAKGEKSFRFDSEMINTFYHRRDTLSKKISYHFKLFTDRIRVMCQVGILKRKPVWTPGNNKKVTVLNYSCTQITPFICDFDLC